MATMASKPQIGFGLGQELFRKVHTRRGTKKTRTGCFCCKKRRVKCDENRPNCLRCIQFGIKCDGYPPPPKKNVNPKILVIPSTAIVERPNYSQVLAGPYARPKLMVVPSSPLKFADETEERYFRTFQNETAAELEGWFDSSFWHRLILQACVEEPFTQKVVTALAAMSTSKKLLHNTDTDTSHRAIVAQQTEFAYKQYQKALQEMRNALEKAGDSRKALIGCILVCCFESLVGNTASAHAHAISGQRLLEQWLVQHPYKNPLEIGIASPASHLIEDDIIQAANFFNCQVSAYLDPRPASEHARLRHEGDETMAHMPHKFETMRDAHRYAMLMFRRIIHSIREVAELAGDGRISTNSNFQILEEGVSALSISPGKDQSPEPQVADPYAFAVQQGQCSLELSRWRSAFSGLYERIMLSTDKREQAAAKSLIALTRAFDITIAVSLDTDNCSCDHLTSVFQEVLDLERDVILYRKVQNPAWQYSFDLIVNSVLFTVARFCRERTIRREAISLMHMFRTREGYHDEQYYAALATKSMELEEEGVEMDYIPARARVRQLDEIVHPEQRWSRFHYVRGTDETVRVAEFRW